MIELNRIYNEDCFETMQKMCINKTSVGFGNTAETPEIVKKILIADANGKATP